MCTCVCVCVYKSVSAGAYLPWCKGRSQKTTLWRQFSPTRIQLELPYLQRKGLYPYPSISLAQLLPFLTWCLPSCFALHVLLSVYLRTHILGHCHEGLTVWFLLSLMLFSLVHLMRKIKKIIWRLLLCSRDTYLWNDLHSQSLNIMHSS